jgi:low temperature requirement protein LtrA
MRFSDPLLPNREPAEKHEVTPLELFFDLVFVFAPLWIC